MEKILILVHGALECRHPVRPWPTLQDWKLLPSSLFLSDGVERVIGRRNAAKLAQTA
jgi:hypothetical protein